jgi:indole-3-acetate monooxygenase
MTTSTGVADIDTLSATGGPLAAARSIADELAALGAEAEQQRSLPAAAVELLARHSLFHLFVPRSRGGLECGLLEGCSVIEEVAAADPAIGWCLLKTSSTNMFAAMFPLDVAAEIWPDRRAVAAGSLNPKGRAVRVDGGYRLTGRWDWGTASSFATWLMGGAKVVAEGADAPTMTAGGPEIVTMFFPADDATLIDTWHTAGMCGTGSGDFEVKDLFVPDRFVMAPPAAPPDGELFKIPPPIWMMVPHAAVAIGIARAAVDALVELASTKTPLLSSTVLGDKEWVHDAVARATALVESSRAYVQSAVSRAYGSPAPDPRLWGHLSLAATHATHACVEAVDLMHRAAGGSAVYSSSILQRHFRDIHVAASHYLVNIEKYAATGKNLLALGAQ